MRADVKLGMVMTMVVVVVGGGYFMYRDNQEAPISLADSSLTTPTDTDTATPTGSDRPAAGANRPANRSTLPAGVRQPRTNANPQRAANRQQRANRRNPANRPRTTPSQPAAGSPTRNPAANRKSNPAAPQRTPENEPRTNPTDASANSPAGNASQPLPGGRPDVAEKLAEAAKLRQKQRAQQAANKNRATPANTANPGRLTAQPPARTSQPALSSASNVAVDLHRVQSGDSFASLAATYYGSERYTNFLIEANPHVKSPDRLALGTVLKIPPRPSDPSQAARTTSAPNAPTGGPTYVVQPGDSFYRIASQKLGDSARWKELLALNRDMVGGDPTKLQVGQVIRLPAD